MVGVFFLLGQKFGGVFSRISVFLSGGRYVLPCEYITQSITRGLTPARYLRIFRVIFRVIFVFSKSKSIEK